VSESEFAEYRKSAQSGPVAPEVSRRALVRLLALATPRWSPSPAAIERAAAALEALDRDGGVVDVGKVPQIPVVLLAALARIARGTPTIVVTPESPAADPDLMQAVRCLGEEAGVRTSVLPRRIPAPRRQADYESADLSVVDVVRLGDEVHRAPDRFEQRRPFLVVADIDLCLYDRRLLVYETGVLRVAAAVVRAGGEPPEWFEHENLFDWSRALGGFDGLSGTAAGLLRETAGELRTVYGVETKWIAGVPRLQLPRCLIYRTLEEKLGALLDAIRSGADAVRDLVFTAWPWTADWVQRALRAAGVDVVRTNDVGALVEALTSSRGRAVVHSGVPPADLSIPGVQGPVRVRIAEPLLLSHHYLKIDLFGRDLPGGAERPDLYFAIEDAEDIWVVTTGPLLDRAFRLMDGLQGLRVADVVRAWTGRRLLMSCYRMRRRYWQEDAPLFTWYHGRPKKPTRKERKQNATRLDAPCFCGSGKPFRECHGRFMAAKGRRKSGGAG